MGRRRHAFTKTAVCVARERRNEKKKKKNVIEARFRFFSPFERAKSFGVERHGKERGRRSPEKQRRESAHIGSSRE